MLGRHLAELGSKTAASFRAHDRVAGGIESVRSLCAAAGTRTSAAIDRYPRVALALERVHRRLGVRGVKAVAAIGLCLVVATPVLGVGVVTGLVLHPSARSTTSTGSSGSAAVSKAGGPSVVSAGSNGTNLQVAPQDLTTYAVSGTVTNSAGAGLGGISVSAYDATGAPFGTPGTTASDGTYSISLPPASYTIGFSDTSGTYGSGRWSNTGFTADSGTAGTISIDSANVAGISVALPSARHITGSVSDPTSGAPLSNIEVDAYDASGFQFASTSTAADGTFTLPVAPGYFEVGYKSTARAGGYWSITGLSYGFSGAARVNLTSVVQAQVNVAIPNVNVPGKPTAVVATRGNGSASVSWSAAPANGNAITGYAVTSSPGGLTCATTGALSCGVSGLTNGTSYTFTVTATNGIGTGDPSLPSAPVVPATVPTKPLGVAAEPNNTRATVSWSAPSSDGGDSIAAYTVTSSPGGKTCATSGGLTCVVTGLTNGTVYTFTVTAVNGVGVSPASDPSIGVTPAPSRPDQPTGVTASNAGLGAAIVAWTAPSDNGSPITGYTVTASPGGSTCTSSGALNCTVSGMSSGTFTFTVTATNGMGTSDPSIASNSVAVYTGATFHSIPLVRVIDTRISKGATTLIAQHPQSIQFSGTNGIPTGATAITGTIVAIGGSYGGYVLVAPTAACSGFGSIDNFLAGENQANGFTVGLDGTGKASVVYCDGSSTTHTANLVLDLSGYYTNDTTGATYHSITPVRIVDTRINLGITGALPANTVKTFQVTGGTSIPSGAVAITGNATVVGGTASGSITVGPSVSSSPPTSTVNFPANDTRSVGVTLGLTTSGTLGAVYPASSGSVAFVFDVTGYFTNDVTGFGFHAITPYRLMDTRSGIGLSGKFTANTPRGLPVAGHGVIPSGATAVTGNLTTVNSTNGWSVYAGPVSTGSPPTTTLNFPTGDIRSNGLTSGLGSGYLYMTYSTSGSYTTDLIFDATGYFS